MRFILTLLFLFCSNSAFGNTCLLSKYKKYTSAQSEWQNDLSSLLVKKEPKLETVINLYRDDQLAYIFRKLLAVQLLLETSPEKVRASKKVNQWLQMNKSEHEILANKNPAYNKLHNNVLSNRLRETHPDGDKVRELMRVEIMQTEDFKKLLSEFTNKVDKINDIECQ